MHYRILKLRNFFFVALVNPGAGIILERTAGGEIWFSTSEKSAVRFQIELTEQLNGE